ncbi:hypothetical protein DM02DRAFT_6491 [Periconia macrospinosa]|uniref:Complex 1 LYR protein domain-containing protein n=1 Tax=Periconia macrospinosa TaxID=97972 RepID=A0A2V1EDG5_9PLEO|nr:hypothetical protein DM02DRAFT_6491 [Periconia macrospinosa]
MPRYIQPKQRSEHRIAAIALYRALLSRCSSSPLPAEDRTSLRNVVRNKFRRNRKIQSTYQLGLVFHAGYETLSHLDASIAGNSASIDALRSLIPSLPQGIKRTFSLPPKPAPQPARNEFTCLPQDRAVLNVRPHANVSGPRHVPILASANGIPFLRLGKPQSPALSRVLRQKLQSRTKRFHEKTLLSNYWSPIARQEDAWDDILETNCGVADDIDTGVRWIDQVDLACRNESKWYEMALAQDRAVARKMAEIVEEETKLAKQEGQRIQKGRRKKPMQERWLV